MSLAAPLATPFFGGGGTSTLVPGKYDCALNGLNFMQDWKRQYTGTARIGRQSISLLKPQQDSSGAVSEASLNPEEFARRAAESWHHGAGQTYHDRTGSDEYRFRTSKGVDVWTKWKLGLLNDTGLKKASANTNLALVVAGSRVYMVDGTALRYSTDLTSWTAVTGTPGTAANGIATDGYNVWTAHGADGIYVTNTGTGASSSYNTRASGGIIAYVKGRLIISNLNVLVNITGAATESILLTHPNSAFRWVAATEGPGWIYAAGYAGDKTLIYKTAIQQDAVALDSPTVAGELPDGETARSLQGYLGYLFAGTDKGLRLLQLGNGGDVTSSGDVIPTDSPVYCLEPQERFVWFGLSDYDSSSTGLGRADLREFTTDLTPAYASDLMASTSGTVLSVVTFAGVRVFAVSGVGVYGETTDKVASGTVDSGLITYGLPDTKVAMYLDTRFESLVGSVTVAMSSDGGSFVTLQTVSEVGDTMMVTSLGQSPAETFEVRVTLARDGSDTTEAPSVRRWTMEANPAPGRGEFIDLALLLFESVETKTGPAKMDVASVYRQLLSMEAQGKPILYQDGMSTDTVFLDDHEFLIDSLTQNRRAYQGAFVARLRRPRSRS